MTAQMPVQTPPRPRILCVDDEPEVLAALTDVLHRRYDVVTAAGASEAIRKLLDEGPFTVVMSDFAMPGMNGAQLLAQVSTFAPAAIRVLLTGQATFDDAIAAVNEGSVFRLLTKPTTPASVIRALEDAVEQARLVTVDRELLERKLESLSGHLVRVERLASVGSLACAIGLELGEAATWLQQAVDRVKDDADAGRPARPADLETLAGLAERLRLHTQGLLQVAPTTDPEDEAVCDLRLAVAGSINLLRAAGLLVRTNVAFRPPDESVSVAINQSRMEQVVLNLLRNAIEASTAVAGADVTVRLERIGAEIGCTIEDRGHGISKADLPLVFEPYFTTRAALGGTGLGLYVVRQIVEGHGGTVTVVSEPDRGTTVSFVLPAAGARR